MYGDNPRPGRPETKWAQSLADDIKAFEATEGSTDNPSFLSGVESVPWSRAAKMSGHWYRGVVDAPGRFMTKWHRGRADKTWPIQATIDANNSNKGKVDGGEGWGGAYRFSRVQTPKRNGTLCGIVPVGLFCGERGFVQQLPKPYNSGR